MSPRPSATAPESAIVPDGGGEQVPDETPASWRHPRGGTASHPPLIPSSRSRGTTRRATAAGRASASRPRPSGSEAASLRFRHGQARTLPWGDDLAGAGVAPSRTSPTRAGTRPTPGSGARVGGYDDGYATTRPSEAFPRERRRSAATTSPATSPSGAPTATASPSTISRRSATRSAPATRATSGSSAGRVSRHSRSRPERRSGGTFPGRAGARRSASVSPESRERLRHPDPRADADKSPAGIVPGGHGRRSHPER